MKAARCCVSALALAAVASHALPARAQSGAVEKPGSLYLQCDGQPNNMTAGESAARLLGAVTLLALFAPPPESSDPAKRKFAADGVAVCTALIDGDKKEGNPERRTGLILARAIHQIEAKNYEAAIADAKLAQNEAEAAGLMANPYYARSRGQSFAMIEAAALYRLDRTKEASDVALRGAPLVRNSFLNLAAAPAYLFKQPAPSEAEAAYFGWRARSAVVTAPGTADRLEEWGRFAEAAQVREALVDFNAASIPDLLSSTTLAQSAVTLMLAGDSKAAAARAAQARANLDKRRADGKPENDASAIVELLDLYSILEMAGAGDLKGARRLFSARSQWVAASFGCVVEATRRLRAGASEDERIGGLSRDPEAMWKDRLDAARAEATAKDSDNKTLFYLAASYDTPAAYRAVSKQVWRTTKSKMLLQIKKPEESKLKLERLFLYGVDANVVLDAYSLHAALLAKSRGHKGFVILPLVSQNILAAGFRTGNPGDPGMPAALFNDAEEVIANLSQLIPDPETLKVIKANEAKATRPKT